MAAVKVLAYFNANVSHNGSPLFLEFAPGQVIRDETLAQELIVQNCPVALLDDQDSVICPLCHRMCSRKVDFAEVTISKLNCVLPYNGQTFFFRAGQVVHPELVAAAKAANLQVELGNGIRCPNPKCGHLWY